MMLNDAPSLPHPGLMSHAGQHEARTNSNRAIRPALPYPTHDEIEAVRRDARHAQGRILIGLLRRAVR